LTFEGLDRELVVPINKAAKGMCGLQHVGTDMALLHQLLNMKVDWGHSCEEGHGFNQWTGNDLKALMKVKSSNDNALVPAHTLS
jgi:hypothetical protein